MRCRTSAPLVALTLLLAHVAAAAVSGAPQSPARPRPPGAPAGGTAIPRDGTPVQPAPPPAGTAYRVRPPEGYLPWPQHNPAFAQEQYDQMMNTLFILNNFGLYQGGDTRDSTYFHDGLDIVLPNGTPIYAIARGTLRAITGSAPSYQSMLVEDADRPGWAWMYTHVQPGGGVRVGATVEAGTQIASVRFEGIEHIHLTRSFLTPGGSWADSYARNDVDPTPFFFYEDAEAPLIETPFYYFLNQSTMMLPRGSRTLVSGQIDVVAGVRDVGKYARGRVPNWPPTLIYGDRNAPRRITVAIAAAESPERTIWSQTAIDMDSLVLNWRPGFGLRDPDRVETVFAFRPATNPDFPRDYNGVYSYYVLTNRSRAGGLRAIDPGDGAPSWDTAAVDGAGRALFPDGEYVITVTAMDWKGNTRSAQDRVIVLNRR